MVMQFFRGPDETGLAHIEHQILTMLSDCRHSFDLSFAALLTGGDPAVLATDVRTTDGRINRLEQEIRRELVVHATVRGSQDVGRVLAYLMVTRMIERAGDQAKNILDLALEGVSFAGAADLPEMVAYRDEISAMFGTVAAIFTDADEARARDFLARADELLKIFDRLVTAQLHTTEPASHAVPRALLYRYLKRITANLANIVSSAILPVDKIDYYGPVIDRDE